MRKNAFTMSETLTTVAILGAVAALLIPSIYKRHSEAANRTKARKAMAMYETVLNTIVQENRLLSNAAFDRFANVNGCTNTRPYFKAVQTIGNNNCRFMTTDKVFWDISDFRNTLIAFRERDLDEDIAEDTANNNAFKFISGYDTVTRALTANDRYYNGDNSDTDVTMKLLEYVHNKVNIR